MALPCMRDALRIAVLLSGQGSNFHAIADYATHSAAFNVVGVISDRASAYGLERARSFGIPAIACERANGSRAEHETALSDQLARLSPDLLVLAGYMRVLSPAFVGAWRGRIVNVHPSLLPKYRGLDTYARALAAADTHHGASVHFVTEQLDGGPVIAQHAVAIEAQDTEQTLRAKVQHIEYQLYPRVIDALAHGDVRLHDDRILWRDAPLDAALTLDELTRVHT